MPARASSHLSSPPGTIALRAIHTYSLGLSLKGPCTAQPISAPSLPPPVKHKRHLSPRGLCLFFPAARAGPGPNVHGPASRTQHDADARRHRPVREDVPALPSGPRNITCSIWTGQGAVLFAFRAHRPRTASAFPLPWQRQLGCDPFFFNFQRIIFSLPDFIELRRNFLTPVETSRHPLACNFL